MKKTGILILLLSMILMANGQAYYETKALNDFYSAQRSSGHTSKRTLTLENIKGSPYLNDDFITGSVLMKDSVMYEGIPLRYNTYQQCMEFKTAGGDVLEMVENPMLQEIQVGDKIFIYYKYWENKRVRESYFQRLNAEGVLLLKKFNVSFQEAQPAQPYTDPEPAKFVPKADEYYLLLDDKPAERFKKTKELAELLFDKSTKVSSFIKKNKIRMNDEDLLSAVKYYNALKDKSMP